MARKRLTLPSFQAVAAGQTAVINVPAVDSYHGIVLKYLTATAGLATQANVEAEIDEVRLKVNGKVQRTLSARQLFDMNSYHGIAPIPGGGAGVYMPLPFYFSEPWRRSVQGEDLLAWHMGDVETFQIEVDINAAAASPQLMALADRETSPLDKSGRPVPMGPIIKHKRYVLQPSAVGVYNAHDLPKNDSYFAMHFDSVDIDSIDLKIDGEDWFDGVSRLDLAQLYADQGFVMNADWTVLDFASTGRVGHARPMIHAGGARVKDMRLDLDMGAAGAFDLITETFGLRD